MYDESHFMTDERSASLLGAPEFAHEEMWRWGTLILERTGLLFGPKRKDRLARGVMAAARLAGFEDREAYYDHLLGSGPESDSWDELISSITVGETYFFRNSSHFNALRGFILPHLMARHAQDRRLRIWSAGCGTGEEPYSVAMLLHELLPDIERWNVLILATDINRRALQQARQGRYREWSFRVTHPAIRDRYFTRRDELFELNSLVREAVTFAYLYLAENAYPSLATNSNAMDLILCRNVAMPEGVMREIAARLHRCLLPDGWLIVGASETSSQIYGQFAARSLNGAVIYQKSAERFSQPPRPAHQTGSQIAPAAAAPAFQPAKVRRPPEPGPPEIGHRREEPVALYEQGLALLSQGRYEEAQSLFLSCLEGNPDSAAVCYQMARALANQGRLEEARSWCQQAVARNPLLIEAHYTLALIHQEQAAFDQAIAQLKQTLYLDPDFVLAHFSLANLYRQAREQEGAVRHHAQAIRLAAKLAPQEILPGSDGLNAGRLLTMLMAAIGAT